MMAWKCLVCNAIHFCDIHQSLPSSLYRCLYLPSSSSWRYRKWTNRRWEWKFWKHNNTLTIPVYLCLIATMKRIFWSCVGDARLNRKKSVESKWHEWNFHKFNSAVHTTTFQNSLQKHSEQTLNRSFSSSQVPTMIDRTNSGKYGRFTASQTRLWKL